MLTTALFAIAKTWKQCKHQQMNGSRNCGIYMQWYVKKERNSPKKKRNAVWDNMDKPLGPYAT